MSPSRFTSRLVVTALTLVFSLQGHAPAAESGKKPQKEQEKGWFHKRPDCEQVGTASWYGPGFHGKETASGETFDQNELTAAHRNLPLGTEVEVTNLETGEKVEVEITDRGPYAGKRSIDLSRKAGREVGLKEEGTAKVKIEAESVPGKDSGRTVSCADPALRKNADSQ